MGVALASLFDSLSPELWLQLSRLQPHLVQDAIAVVEAVDLNETVLEVVSGEMTSHVSQLSTLEDFLKRLRLDHASLFLIGFCKSLLPCRLSDANNFAIVYGSSTEPYLTQCFTPRTSET